MSLPSEINIQRMKDDGYPIVFNTDQDYSEVTITLMTETANISPVIITATTVTFPGTHFASLDTGLHPYKVVIVSLGIQRTIVMGSVQIVNDNLVVTP